MQNYKNDICKAFRSIYLEEDNTFNGVYFGETNMDLECHWMEAISC